MIGLFTLAFSQYQVFQCNVSKGNTTALFGESAKTKSIEKQGRGFSFSPQVREQTVNLRVTSNCFGILEVIANSGKDHHNSSWPARTT